MRFAAEALLERGVAATAIYVSMERNMQCGVGHCGHCQLGPTLDLPRRPGLPLGRAGAADGGAGAVSGAASRRSPSGSSPRATAASSRCSTARTSCSRWPARSRSPTSSRRRRATVEGPYDLSLVEGSVTTAARRGADPARCAAQSRQLVTIGACATAGGIQALRNFADVDEFVSLVYATPEYISTLATSTPISAHVHVDFELHGCPINKRQLLEVITRLPPRAAAEHPVDERLHRVQAARHGLRDGRARHAVPRPGHARRLRRPLPLLRPRLLRLLRADGDAEHGLARPGSSRCSALGDTDVERVFRTFNVEAFEESPRRRWLSAGRPRSAPTTSPASRARARCTSRSTAASVDDVKLRIFEPPRFFEAFLRGRAFTEAPDITARICGICPVAYQMSSVHAMEQLCGVEVGGQLRALRRLLYCGEWIESHALHVFMLHAPDFLGYESAIELARDHPRARRAGARAEEDRQRGDDGRRRARGPSDQRPRRRLVPRAARSASSRRSCEKLERAREIALEAVRAHGGPRLPRLRAGLRVRRALASRTSTRSTADGSSRTAVSTSPSPSTTTTSSRSTSRGRTRSTRSCEGAAPTSAARSRASRSATTGCRRSPARPRARPGSAPDERNPFRSIVVRAVELVYAADEALRLIADYEEPDAPAVEVDAARRRRPRLHRGAARHPLPPLPDRRGRARSSTRRSCPPTSQNQRTIEEDLRGVVERSLDVPDEELTLLCEQTIRNYDPCISCATHFLKLEVERR